MLLLEEMIDSFNDLFIMASLCDGLIAGVAGLLLPCAFPGCRRLQRDTLISAWPE